ncbi:hypothetical protein Tco_0589225 [Tanacetum coccineum]
MGLISASSHVHHSLDLLLVICSLDTVQCFLVNQNLASLLSRSTLTLLFESVFHSPLSYSRYAVLFINDFLTDSMCCDSVSRNFGISESSVFTLKESEDPTLEILLVKLLF